MDCPKCTDRNGQPVKMYVDNSVHLPCSLSRNDAELGFVASWVCLKCHTHIYPPPPAVKTRPFEKEPKVSTRRGVHIREESVMYNNMMKQNLPVITKMKKNGATWPEVKEKFGFTCSIETIKRHFGLCTAGKVVCKNGKTQRAEQIYSEVKANFDAITALYKINVSTPEIMLGLGLKMDRCSMDRTYRRIAAEMGIETQDRRRTKTANVMRKMIEPKKQYKQSGILFGAMLSSHA